MFESITTAYQREEGNIRFDGSGLNAWATLNQDDRKPSISSATDGKVVGESGVCYPFLGPIDNPVF
jgi:hypothetical protein